MIGALKVQAVPAPAGSRVSQWLSSGWIPGALLLVITALTLRWYGVRLEISTLFALYTSVFVTVPGTLVWRALSGTAGALVEELAAGTALGSVVTVLAYIPARALNVPLGVLVWPAAVYGLFLGVRPLRGYWRGGGRAPVWWLWTLSGLVLGIVGWSAAAFFHGHPLTSPGYRAPYVDIVYQLAVAGEVKHHVPPVQPQVAGQPLNYHWFFFAKMAADSWVTGLELQLLLFRLEMLPLLASLAAVIAAVARRLTGSWGAAALAAVLMFAAKNCNPWFPGPLNLVDDRAPFESTIMWTIPTQMFGALLFALAMLVIIDLLRDPWRRRRRWVLLAVILLGVMGAKATFLPMLVAGLAVVVLLGLLRGGRLDLTSSGVVAIAVPLLSFAQLVLYAGGSQGMRLAPLFTIRRVAAAYPSIGFGSLLLIHLLCYGFLWAGALVVITRRGALRDRPTVLVVAFSVSGLAATFLFGHPGNSQLYFLESARPYLSVLSAWGIVEAARRLQFCRTGHLQAATPVTALVSAAALTGGVGIVCAASTLGTDHLVQAYLLLLAVLLPVGALVLRRRSPLAVGAMLAMLVIPLGYGIPTLVSEARKGIERKYPVSITAGGREAGRWLRAHTSPGELIATNVHCLTGWLARGCDNRHFWIAAFSERRMLVEGWGFTEPANDRAPLIGPYSLVPFWDRNLLAANDNAFRHPSRPALRLLAHRYGVHWLLLDMTHNRPAAGLARLATLRYRNGDCAIYQIPASA